MQRLQVKWQTASKYLPEPIESIRDASNSVGIIHFGTSMESTHEAIDSLSTLGQACNDLRILSFPFHQQVREFIDRHDQIFVIEQNRDAQMRGLIVNELEIDPARLTPVLHFNGDPISASFVYRSIAEKLELATEQTTTRQEQESAIN